MSRSDGVLACVVSRKPWEMFDAGIKGAEYRADAKGKDGWARKILSGTILGTMGRDWYYPEDLADEADHPSLFHPYLDMRDHRAQAVLPDLGRHHQEEENPMTNAEKISLIRKWQAAHDANKSVMDKLEPLFGSCYFDGELGKAVWSHFDMTTELVALILGDEHGWCSWYAMENDFGRKGMEAGPVGDMRKIASPSRLLWVIGATA